MNSVYTKILTPSSQPVTRASRSLKWYLSLTKCAEHGIALFLLRVASETLCRSFCARHPIRLAVPPETLKTPAAGLGVSFAVLYHHIYATPRSFCCHSRVLSCFKEVSHNN